MKQLLPFIIILLTLNSCKNQETEKNVDKEQMETVSDSTIPELVEQHKSTEISEPFDISQLEITDRFDFTSGGLPKKDQQDYCENEEKGFFGRYNLIDRQSNLEPPVVGTIDIYKSGKMSSWRASDTSQTIWRIHLKSDVISVWDSIHVGLPRDKIVQFGQTNKGFCMKKGDFYYSCDFNNFSVVYNFKNDTLTELTVTRNCEREMKKN